MTIGDIRAVVPVKRLLEAKLRLAGLLNAEERVGLSLAMLEDVLAVVTRLPILTGTLVVTDDPRAAATALQYGAGIVREPHEPGLSAAVAAAADALTQDDADAMLFLPGDVPLVSVDEIEQILALQDGAPCVVIAPDADERGSNAMLCAPPDAISFRFGEDSFHHHRAAARAHGIEPRIVRLPGIGRDIDRPEDIAAFAEQASTTRTRRYLEAAGILRRLADTAAVTAGR